MSSRDDPDAVSHYLFDATEGIDALIEINYDEKEDR